MTGADLAAPPAQIPRLAPDWHWAAWITRVGTLVTDDAVRTLPYDVVLPLGWASDGQFTGSNEPQVGDPYAVGRDELVGCSAGATS
jgi:hypothetical protein